MKIDLNDDSTALEELAKKFKVSTMAMSIRVTNLHLVHGHGTTKHRTNKFWGAGEH